VRADEYQRAAKNLGDFLVAFDQLMLDLEPVRASGLSRFPRWEPKPGRQSQVERHYSEVARLAGPAAVALDLSGAGTIDYKLPGTFQTRPMNPAMVWSTMFGETPMLDPSLMFTVGQQALGLLEHKQAEQAARQRGLIGAVAWFFTLAPRVREAAGLPARSVRGQAVTWTVAIAQGLIVTTVGGVLIYPLAKVLGWYP
jgi:hypothetical protein